MKLWKILGVLCASSAFSCSSDDGIAPNQQVDVEVSHDASSDLRETTDSSTSSDVGTDGLNDASTTDVSNVDSRADVSAEADVAPDAQPDVSIVPELCDAIKNETDQELCLQTEHTCEGVFENGMGCTAFCAQTGLNCGRVFENLESMCARDPAAFELECGVETGNPSDFCVCVDDTCVADCSGKTCGGDGCGGSCGSCTGGAACQNGLCKDL